MIEILVATNREGAVSKIVAQEILKLITDLNTKAQILDLGELNWEGLNLNKYGENNIPDSFKPYIERINKSEGVMVICPEYNGSFPGVVKTFLDFWSFPQSFEHRPFAFVGLGGMFGGLRGVEHLQQIFGYRNGYIFPDRIFIQQVRECIKDGKITSGNINDRLKMQARDFVTFIEALKLSKLHALNR